MCCSLVNKEHVETIFSPFYPTAVSLLKAQTFAPFLGVIPAAATVVIGLITCITAIALKFFAAKEAQTELNHVISMSLSSMSYSVVNIASGGLFAPICEYATELLSSKKGEKNSTAGFFDIFGALWRGETLKFL